MEQPNAPRAEPKPRHIPKSLRKYSANSQNALLNLHDLRKQYRDIENRVSTLESQLDDPIPKEKQTQVLNEVAQLHGYLDKLQFNGVDSIVTAELSSGKEDAKSRRKSLNTKCETLRERVLALHKALAQRSTN